MQYYVVLSSKLMPLVPSFVKIYHLVQNFKWTHIHTQTHTHTHTHTKGRPLGIQKFGGSKVGGCVSYFVIYILYVRLAILQVSPHYIFLFSINSWFSYVPSSCWYTIEVLVRALCYLPLFGRVLSTIIAMSFVTSFGICNTISPVYIMCKIRITPFPCRPASTRI